MPKVAPNASNGGVASCSLARAALDLRAQLQFQFQFQLRPAIQIEIEALISRRKEYLNGLAGEQLTCATEDDDDKRHCKRERER